MKEAFWALGIIVVALFGLVLINLFGNITVTNQLNYTTMKNAVEASMYDSIDMAHYRAGFCLCTNLKKNGTKWTFNDDSQYEIIDITYENGKKASCKSSKTCEILYGEYRIDKKIFSESLIRRVAEMANNKKDYEVVVKDVIEYPPKVSVRINTRDTDFSPTEKNSGGYEIVNQMDAIIESWGISPKVVVTTPTPTVKPTSTPKPTVPPTNSQKAVCCYNKNNDVYKWSASGICDSGYSVNSSITNESNCQSNCYHSLKDTSVYDWGTPQNHPRNDSKGNKIWSLAKSYKRITTKKDCKSACYKKNSEYKWFLPDDTEAKDWKLQSSITSESKCKAPKANQPSCTWHYNTYTISCTKKESKSCYTKNYDACGCTSIPDSYTKEQCKQGCKICASCSGTAKLENGSCYATSTKSGGTIPGASGFSSGKAAVNSCNSKAQAAANCPAGYTPNISCTAWQTFNYQCSTGSSGSYSNYSSASGSSSITCASKCGKDYPTSCTCVG